jgi:hypothetical protein
VEAAEAGTEATATPESAPTVGGGAAVVDGDAAPDPAEAAMDGDEPIDVTVAVGAGRAVAPGSPDPAGVGGGEDGGAAVTVPRCPLRSEPDPDEREAHDAPVAPDAE